MIGFQTLLLLRRQLNMFKFFRFAFPAKAGIQWRTPVSRWGEGMPSPFAGTTKLTCLIAGSIKEILRFWKVGFQTVVARVVTVLLSSS